jgi:glycosyltransferase involved in cell wall biosynthesis
MLRQAFPSAFVVNGCQYYHRYRNIETVVAAVERLAARGTKDLLLLLSVDPKEEGAHSSRFVARLSSSRLTRDGGVLNFGRLTLAEIRSLYCVSDVAVFPSIAESFSNAYLDALVSGCPVIASDIDLARGVLGDAGLYFDHWSPDALADLLEAVRQDRGQLVGRRWLARARAREFSWDRTRQAFVSAVA